MGDVQLVEQIAVALETRMAALFEKVMATFQGPQQDLLTRLAGIEHQLTISVEKESYTTRRSERSGSEKDHIPFVSGVTTARSKGRRRSAGGDGKGSGESHDSLVRLPE